MDVRVKVVTFDADFMARAYVTNTKLSWPLLLDQDRKLYQEYGFSRGDWRSIYGFSSIVKYLRLIFKGRRPGKPGSDWRQLGGDVLIDPDSMVRLHHVSENPHDRPTFDAIVSTVEQNPG